LNQLSGETTDLCHVFAISDRPVEKNAQIAAMLQLAYPLLSDEDHRVADLYGADPAASGTGSVFLGDPNRQITYVAYKEQQGFQSSLLPLIKALDREDTIVTGIHAPVLYIPRALDPELCAALVDLHETAGHARSGLGRDGTAGRYFDDEKKTRSDHKIRDPEMIQRLSEAMQKRVIPEVHKVFNFQITRLEEFKIGRYDADDQGHFYPHRDNVGLGYRRFAMSLNLNVGEYEGGYLRFPEYGPTRYRPGTGDAVIFSCSLLHEATRVTSGKRYVLLGFFFDEAANRIRQTRPLRSMAASMGGASR
jgi:predicted 2-oxoglutarate/Fe(II)-dependent dioxygenase YbiX